MLKNRPPLYPLIIAISVYAIIRAYAFANINQQAIVHGGDGTHYFNIAVNLAKTGIYSENHAYPTESATWRPPIWPLVLSKLISVTHEVKGVLALKIVIEAFVLGILWYTFWALRVHLLLLTIVLVGVAIEPQFIKYAGTFLSENLTAVLLLIMILCYLYHPKSSNKLLNSVLLALFGTLVILTHPVTIFFVTLTVGIHFLRLAKTKSYKEASLTILVFVVTLMIWPIRNAVIFEQGLYLTASQGATLSKGWNGQVSGSFTNTKGDLADETINLKYIPASDIRIQNIEKLGILQKKKLYTDATLAFIRESKISDLLKIGFKKIVSNLNPFPETPKSGKLELLGSLFRLFYLITVIPALWLVYSGSKLSINPPLVNRAMEILLIIYLGQTAMAAAIYTGIRFNSVYSLGLLVCSFTIWFYFIEKIMKTVGHSILNNGRAV